MEPTWIIELQDGSIKHVTCAVVGVAGDGSLLCFSAPMMNQQPMAFEGYAPGEWKHFYKSSLNMQ